MENLTCKLCSATSHLRLQTCKEYLQHIGLFHAYQPDFKVTCGISGCQRTYTNFGTFRNHVYDVHSASTTESVEVESVNATSMDCNEDYTSNDESEYASDDDASNDCSSSAVLDGCDYHVEPYCSQDMLKRSAAIALLGVKEKFKLTQASLQGIIQSMTALTQQNTSTLKSKVVVTPYVLFYVIIVSSLDLWSFECS